MRKLKLTLSTAALDRLHAAGDGRGVHGEVKKADLRALLLEHQRLLAWHRGEYVEPAFIAEEDEAPAPAATAPKRKPAAAQPGTLL